MSSVLMRQLLVGSWVEAGHQKYRTMFRNVEFSTPVYIPWKGEKELETELMIDRVYVMKPSWKPQKYGLLSASKVDEDIYMLGGWYIPTLQGLLGTWDPSRSCTVSLHLVVHLYPLLYFLLVNKQ